ncbi:DUF885 family protein [Kribbella lupini]|uniref:DUF885 family protein n=1 Tax=Kribbella lupini TaxID=291602 RepID=A0ABN2CK93_9ACTN
MGNYRYNGSGLEDRSQLNAATLIFHELIPGHHSTSPLRYSTGWPGQALGYRLGCEQFWAARREAEDALGAAIDVRAFHEIVLGAGGRLLPMVRDDVRRWVAERQAA